MMELIAWGPYRPELAEEVYVAPGAKIIGRVSIGKGSSIWFNTVLRNDADVLTVGEFTNIQDNSTLHGNRSMPIIIGSYVTVGHGAILDACAVGDYCLIGMGAVIMEKAEIGRGSVIGAGALVTGGTKIPPYSLVLGAPAKVVKTLDESSEKERQEQAVHYYELAQQYRQNCGASLGWR